MKFALFIPLALAGVAALIAAAPKKETPPPGAADKIAEALPEKAFAEAKKKRKLLVFSKTAGFRHKSIATGKVALAEMGKKTGAFEAVISDDLSNFEPGNIDQFDAILFLSTTQNVFKDAKDEELLQKSLMEFIKSGKGFVGIHAATDTFYNWPEYGEMIGGYFDGHPWNAGTKVHINVVEGKEDHPLVSMLDGNPLVFKEEIYQLRDPYDSSKIDLLLELDTAKSDPVKKMKRDPNDYGVAWAKPWGEGRVFYCSIGHNHDMYWHPKVLSHYLAGIQWALGDYEVDITIPANQ